MTLASLEAEHEQEHAFVVGDAHDGKNHAHEDAGVEFLSKVEGQAGFASLTFASISLYPPAPLHALTGAPQYSTGTDSFSPVLLPLAAPPPKGNGLHGGGGQPA